MPEVAETHYLNLSLAEVAVARQDGTVPIDFATDPSRYRHWRLDVDGAIAMLTLKVDPDGGLEPATS